MALRAEAAHEEGRKGVFLTKRWLESTTHLTLSYDAYDMAADCSVTCLDGSSQTFDLRGRFHSPKRGLFVENKSYTGVGGQPDQFQDFLAISYSATATEIARTQDPKWEFMWVTTHPFSQSKWSKLTKRSMIRSALENDKTGILGDTPVDEDLLDLMANRVWLLVLNKRQKDLTLTQSELSKVEAVLKRGSKGEPK
ncbi:hypothetical protein [Microbacterium plantarum]|uniref:Restriction endonuclease type IV Mrr domain-containing protein n=1 Tax=Microbacterium plantarum TaxID=1816425 RepID=A0ABV5EUE2_9MICO